MRRASHKQRCRLHSCTEALHTAAPKSFTHTSYIWLSYLFLSFQRSLVVNGCYTWLRKNC